MFLRGVSGDEKSNRSSPSVQGTPNTPGLATRLRSMFAPKSFNPGVCQRSLNPQVDVMADNRARHGSDSSAPNSPKLRSLHGRIVDLKPTDIRNTPNDASGHGLGSITRDIL
jgi:hypothetical protein